MRFSTLTYISVLTAAGLTAGMAQAADVAVPAEKCDAAWHMASPHGDTIRQRRRRPRRA